ncbi:unnamed protein product [Closterium sp. NIES-54]
MHGCHPDIIHRDVKTLNVFLDIDRHGGIGMLSFDKRLEVALGVAEVLQYMHGCHPAIIHRDVKTLNVFLDKDLHPKLGDFGKVKEISDESMSPTLPIFVVSPSHLMRFLPLSPIVHHPPPPHQPKLGDFGNVKEINDESMSPTHTRVVGTPGYLDPQYCQTSIVSDRSDVYSFGVVLLELITGKAPVLKESDDAGERMALAKWATPAICSGHTDSVADPVLLESSTPQALQAVGSLAAMCVQRLPKDRPAMGEVVRRLKTIRQQGKSWDLDCGRVREARSHPHGPQALQAVGSLAAMCVQRLPKDRPAMGEVVRRLKNIRQQGAH